MEGWHPKGWRRVYTSVTKKHQVRMFSLCETIKKWSICPSGRQHACVLTLEGKFVLATGYNGVPPGMKCNIQKRCDGMYREDMYKICKATHAEVNALKNMLCVMPKRCIAFVSKKPCISCMQFLKDAGVHEVYWRELSKHGTGVVIDKGNKELKHYDPKTGR